MRGVIIANTGSPDSPHPEDVAAYLERFLSNPRIVPMNPIVWKRILHAFVLPKRSILSGKKYETIWNEEGFKFINDHRELARKLEQSFRDDGEDVSVRAAMSFGKPSIESAMSELRAAGCDELVVLPLYPQNAFSQASVVADEVSKAAALIDWSGPLEVVGDYSENELYLQAIAESVRASGFDPSRGDRLIMGFHSIPKTDVDRGDTYEATTSATCAWLANELNIPDGQWALGYQCRFDKRRKWLEPYSHEILDAWWQEGFDGRVFYVCPNFSVDCLETYYDVEGVMKTVWLGRSIESGRKIRRDSFVYIPCLGTTDAHVSVIRDVLKKWVT